MNTPDPTAQEKILNAAETVIVSQGIGHLTFDAVAQEAGVSKGGVLHYYSSKDKLISALVQRSADNWRACYSEAFEQADEGPGRMSRALLNHCLSDVDCWTEELRCSTSAVFSALAQNPELIEPMRDAYSELHQRLAKDNLPNGVSEAVISAIDGLWLNWVLGFAPLDQERVARVRCALEEMLKEPKS